MEVDELNPLVTLPTFEQGCVQPYTTPFRSRRHTIPRWLLFVVAIIGGCSHMCALAVEARPNSTAPLPRTWFAPNMGSADYVDLFSKPDEWRATRSRIGVFKFYTPNLLKTACAICGNNTLDAFVEADAFRKLEKWGIAIAVEVPAVKPWGCGEKEVNVVIGIVQSVERNGGHVSLLAMDEPLEGSQSLGRNAGRGCGLDRDQAAAAVVRYGQDIHARFPGVRIGEIEPYPSSSAAQLGEWVDTLRRAGFNPAFFHLDVDRNAARAGHKDVARDLKLLQQVFAHGSIPFGVILWSPAKSDREFYESTMQCARTVNAALGKPEQIILHDWAGAEGVPHNIPANMTDNDPEYNHIRVINDALGVFNQ